MIIGDASIDPRKVTNVSLERMGGEYKLVVERVLGNAFIDTEIHFADKEDAIAALVNLDGACYKGPPADAIATERLEEEDSDDEQCKIGYKE